MEWETRSQRHRRVLLKLSCGGNIVHLREFANDSVVRIWCSTSCVTVVYIWDFSFSITPVGALPCIGHVIGTFVEASAIRWEYGMNDVILL